MCKNDKYTLMCRNVLTSATKSVIIVYTTKRVEIEGEIILKEKCRKKCVGEAHMISFFII